MDGIVKTYELYEVIQELKKDNRLVFKLVLVINDKIVEETTGFDHYLTLFKFNGHPYIRGFRFYKGKFVQVYEGLQVADTCKWIISNDLDDFLED